MPDQFEPARNDEVSRRIAAFCEGFLSCYYPGHAYDQTHPGLVGRRIDIDHPQ